MSFSKYIAINAQSDQTSERDLRTDVGEFAYVDWGTISAPFDAIELSKGSFRFDGENWDDVQNAPNLPSKGLFFVSVSGNTKEIRFISDEIRDENCVKSRCGELVVINGVAESWNYYVTNDETFQFGEIALPSAFDKGLAKDTKLRTLAADYVRQYAQLNRGKRVGDINFNTTIANGNTHIEFSGNSLFAPPTNENKGVLRNEIAGCVILQYWYPENSDALYTRERNEAKVWTSWYTASAGNMLSDGKVKVPSFVKRGIGSGYQFVEVYQAWKAEEKFNLIEGFGIQITDSPSGKIVSWTGTEVPFSPQYPLEYDAISGNLGINSTLLSNWNAAYSWGNHALAGYLTSYTETDPTVPSWVKAITSTQVSNWNAAFTWGNHALAGYLTSYTETDPTVPSWVKAITSTQVSNWNAAFAWGNHAGLYAPLARALQVSGTAGRVAVSGGSQTLAADRSWVVDLIAVNATTLSAGSTTQVPVINVDTYGRVTSLSNAAIAFPAETDPTVPSWVKAITSTQVSNWNAAFAWGNHAGLYAPLARALQVSGTAGRVAVSGGSQTLAADRSWVVDLIAVNATTLSAGSTTQVPVINVDTYGRVTSLSNAAIAFPAETDPTVPSWVKAITSTQVSNWNAAFTWGNHALAGYLTSYTETDPTVPSWVKAITSTQVSNWNAAFAWGNHAGLYAPLTRALQVSGTAGRVAVSGGSQTLAADRSWVVDLIAVNATTLSAGSTTQVPVINVDTYGRVTSLSNAAIAFPAETDPTVPSWVKVITSTQVSNWNAAFTWGNHALAGYLTSYTETDPTVPSHVKEITAGNISGWNAKVAGAGTVNWIAKFVNTSEIGNSQISDDGTNVGIGSAPNAAYKVYVNGATYFQGDASDVALYLRSSTAIRAAGSLFIDAAGTSGRLRFRAGSGYADVMCIDFSGAVLVNTITPVTTHKLQVAGGIYSSGQMRLAGYTSSSSFSGTRVGILGFDASGNILSVANDVYADKIHGHSISDISALQSALDGKTPWGHTHTITDITGLQAALDGKTPWGHNHDDRYYTQGQLNTAGGSNVHWDNISNKPGLAYAGHGHTIPDISGLQSALDGKTPWGHTHIISDITGLQAALDNRPTWDSVYTRTQSDGRYIQSESDPFGLDSHWFSVSGNTITLGIQRRNGTQQYASFTSPSASEYSLSLSPFTSGLGHHQINLNKTGGGSSTANIYEQDPYGLTDVSAFYNSSTKVLTLYHNLRNGTTKTLSVTLS